jgi:hypothetical protein
MSNLSPLVAKLNVQIQVANGCFELAGAIKPQTLRIIPLRGELATTAVVQCLLSFVTTQFISEKA